MRVYALLYVFFVIFMRCAFYLVFYDTFGTSAEAETGSDPLFLGLSSAKMAAIVFSWVPLRRCFSLFCLRRKRLLNL